MKREKHTMKKHYEQVIKDTDKRVKHALRMQVMDTESPLYGGFFDLNKLVEAKYAIYQVTTMIGAYCNAESEYYQKDAVKKSIFSGIDYIASVQHENGLFDYIDCNFFSAPDTAFMIKGMLPALHYLQEHERSEIEESIYQKLRPIGRKAAYGLTKGGFHTPNHRWAIASALYECATFFEAPELVEFCNQYLQEGIDCNKDGEFAEKSAGTYNGVNDEAMICMGDYAGDPVYYEYAIRNLRMMMHYLETDGTVFTSNSTRQDNGMRVFPTEYYWMYLRMGYEKNIPEFLSMANYIFDLIDAYHLLSPDILLFFMNHKNLITLEHEDHTVVKTYHSIYPESGIARIACGDFTYTLMRGKSNFLYFSNHSIDLSMKIGGSLCEHRAFVPESMIETEEGIRMEQTMKGWYYLPFQEKPETSDWWEMEHQKRAKIYGPDLHISVMIKEVKNGIDVRMNLTGIQNAPFRVEMAITGAKIVENDFFSLPALPGGCVVAKSGMLEISNENDVLCVGPGFGEHRYTSGKFGSEAQQKESFTVYFTDYTEFEHTIQIRNA